MAQPQAYKIEDHDDSTPKSYDSTPKSHDATPKSHDATPKNHDEITPKIVGGPFFGVSLRELVQRAQTEFILPSIVADCIRYLKDTGAIRNVGIFRMEGALDDRYLLKNIYDKGGRLDFEKQTPDPNAVAGLLKQYLRELNDPLISINLYDKFIKTIDMNGEERLEALRDLFRKMATPNRLIFKLTFEFIHHVAQFYEINKMPATNLATMFSPNVFRAPPETPPETLLSNAFKERTCIEFIILNFYEIFKDMEFKDRYFPSNIIHLYTEEELVDGEEISLDNFLKNGPVPREDPNKKIEAVHKKKKSLAIFRGSRSNSEVDGDKNHTTL